ncbi:MULTISPECIES: hydroxyacid dehydrogenase [unclassified Iodidimonas]|jgi:(S)-sulfolactate dehydrogenase|uniref:hydroxyacid dehydrogenase n=1 Tax=unclassified Iodidimonas TaxID=2626145 RepID=UPI002482AB8F|nr:MULTISPECIES: hydroxyacid dehydrogenase [unclassified Iodidimonas]
MADIVISEFMDEAAITQKLQGFDVLYDPDLVNEPAALLAALADARALIIRNKTQVRGDLLKAAPHLRVIGRLGVGLDNIDLDACAARGIKVCPARGANDLSVAEYVLNASMNLLRDVWSGRDRMLAGHWPRLEMMGAELSGRMMGLVGFGSIAREVARRARIMGMRLAIYDPYLDAGDPALAADLDGVARMALADLLAEADVLSLHVPLTEETRHLIDAPALARMQPGAILINAARGGVVDEMALADALRAGRLAGAALDVFETEPMTAESGAHLRDVPNLLLTPHIAGITGEANLRVSLMTAQSVAAVLASA